MDGPYEDTAPEEPQATPGEDTDVQQHEGQEEGVTRDADGLLHAASGRILPDQEMTEAQLRHQTPESMLNLIADVREQHAIKSAQLNEARAKQALLAAEFERLDDTLHDLIDIVGPENLPDDQ